MTTPEPSDSFEPIPYDPVNPKRRLTSSEHSSHRLQPYTRTSSTSAVVRNNSPSIGSESFVSDNCGGQKEVKKLALKDLPQGEHPAVKWAWKRLVMDLLTTVVWPQNKTDECRDAYLNEVLNQANSMFGTNVALTKELGILLTNPVSQFRNSLAEIAEKLVREFEIKPKDTTLSDEAHKTYMQNHRLMLLDSSEANRWQYFLHGERVDGQNVTLLVFSNPIVEKIHINHLYSSPYTPLREQAFLKEITTTTLHMFSHVAAGVEYGIDKIVEDVIPSSTKKTWRFHGLLHGIRNACIVTPDSQGGFTGAVFKSSSQRTPYLENQVGFSPSTSQPFLQSLSAVLPVPAQEEPYSYISDLTADSQFGLYYCAPPDEDEGPQDPLNQGYSFY
ncbi:uncharacterized protein F5891DRAFT_978714 [Suillus fuscotomentosus]|uniref:DUF6532 domain-containing protein n=1 Tax=Suillus fuscotomentosus TaxID=1912939 RepID=A0AAD4HP47_9AGAM|nr:uncharacterized protein F5891DRAFT_978714 [Suillus fuscotomentosus]KAG1902399.1 hypothetical protein F5891DRAFT_978714 [Suillus fuscotomentosus]